MTSFQPRIAIVGGGPSGLALGLLLHQRGVRSTIYELRPEFTPEDLAKPSGMLDLHEESGLTAMRECGVWDKFLAAVGECSESQRVLDRNGTVVHTDEGELSSRPEIARNALTSLLLHTIPSDIIKWNHKITTARSTRNATTGATEITLDLGLHGTATYDFVVGADGAWSRLRPLLSDIRPIYTGAQYITATVRQVSTKYPHLLSLCGSGSLCALGGGNGIMTQRGPQDSIRVYAAVSTPQENWATVSGLAGKTAVDVKTTLLADDAIFGTWAPTLQDLFSIACEEEAADNPGATADIKPYYMLPIGHRWTHRPGLTLVGDAAHLMTPWGGEGVNLALWDALDLAKVLATPTLEAADAAAWQASLEPELCAFEEKMLARAEVEAKDTDSNREMFLSENGAQRMADFFHMYADMAAAGDAHPHGQQDGHEK